MKKVLSLIVLIILSATLAYGFEQNKNPEVHKGQPGQAQDDRMAPGPERGKYNPMQNLKEELGLTDEQITALKKMDLRFRRETLPIQNSIQEQGLDLQEAMQEDNLDLNKIKKIVQQIGNSETELKVKRVDKLIEMLKVLTPEQKTKFKGLQLFNSFLGQNMHERGGDRGMRPGRGQGSNQDKQESNPPKDAH